MNSPFHEMSHPRNIYTVRICKSNVKYIELKKCCTKKCFKHLKKDMKMLSVEKKRVIYKETHGPHRSLE